MYVKIKTGEDLKEWSRDSFWIVGFVSEQKRIIHENVEVPYAEHRAVLVRRDGSFFTEEIALLKWEGGNEKR